MQGRGWRELSLMLMKSRRTGANCTSGRVEWATAIGQVRYSGDGEVAS